MQTQKTKQPLNYYQILSVDAQVTIKQIRSAFRQKAKRLHPDTVGTHGQSNNSEQQMRLLINAYQTLSHPDLRRDYDLTHKIDTHKFSFSFREFMRKRTNDHKSLARLILYELLHDHITEAIRLYESYFYDELDTSIQRGSIRRRLSYYFSYNDYMDCLFLLADAYEKQHQYLKAIRFYRNIARLESNKAIFGYFFDDVRDAMKRIIRVWEKNSRTQHIVRFVPSLLDIHSLRRDRVFFEQKIARGQKFYYGKGDQEDGQENATAAMPESHLHEMHA